MLRSIRGRLVLSSVFLILLTLGVVGAIILRLIEDSVAHQERETLAASAEVVAQQAALLLQPVPQPDALQNLAESFSLLTNARVVILDADRQVLADSYQDEELLSSWFVIVDAPGWERERGSGVLLAQPGNELPEVLARRLAPAAAVTVLRWQEGPWAGGFQFDVVRDPAQLGRLIAADERPARSEAVVVKPISDGPWPLGYVQVSEGPDLVGNVLATTRRAFLYAAAGALLLAVIVGLVVSRGLAAPLRELARVTARMSDGDLSTRAPVRSRDEIGQLARQFNAMAGRLEASFAVLANERDALRRFVADASHELRTPITALRSFFELLQGTAAGDAAAQAEFLAESQAQIDRLAWITGNLLDLSRLDGGLVTLDLADIPAADLIRTAALPFQVAAHERGIGLVVHDPAPGLRVRGDRGRLEMALSNLLDNALKFGLPGGYVEIGAEARGDAVRLWVRDDGPGIAPADQARLFERFYRGPTSKGSTAPGSGLGLAIVDSVARAHRGQAAVQSTPGAGSLFVIDLPAGD